MTPSDGRPPVREEVELADGGSADLFEREGGWILEVAGVRQSHLRDDDAPPALAVTRWMQAALGPDRSRVVHLGGGLLSLPRAVAAADPQAVQVVVEVEPVFASLVRERFSVPDGVTVQVADARAWLEAGGTPPWTAQACDAVVIDVFAGGRVPPAFTSRECFSLAHDLLAEGGVLVVNSVAGGDLVFTRRQVATLRAEFEHVAVIVQNSSLHRLRFGNAVLIGSDAPLQIDAIRAALSGDPSRGALVTDLDGVIGVGEVVTDADDLWSPEPDLPDAGPALRLLAESRALGSAIRQSLTDASAPDA